jgi:beta-phosphoglucomutase-like phosphatase (HAD superfamily)
LKLAIASSAPRDWVTGHLSRLDLLHVFDCIKCTEDADRAKPSPDLFLAVLVALGVEAARAVVFEDSPNGIRAAKQGGLYCVAVPNPVTAQLCLDEADLCIESLAEVPLESLLARVGGE